MTLDATADCWNPSDPASLAASPVSLIEQYLALPLPTMTLDVLRRRFIQACATDRNPVRGARSVVQLPFDSELHVLLADVPVPIDVRESVVCSRRRYIDIDTEMAQQAYTYPQAIEDAITLGVVSPAYADVILRKLEGRDPRTRMCAVATLLVLSAWVTNQ